MSSRYELIIYRSVEDDAFIAEVCQSCQDVWRMGKLIRKSLLTPRRLLRNGLRQQKNWVVQSLRHVGRLMFA